MLNPIRQKSRKTGVPLKILEKVNEKGGRRRTGHRPGANIQQWVMPEFILFQVKGKTFYTTDRKISLNSNEKKKRQKSLV